jgi:tripartite-type tricarboxylate transporter receptor subunit TctC
MLAAADCEAQAYPNKPVRIVVPSAPGGNIDLVARAVAQKLTASLGQQIIVEPRPGASNLIGTQFVAKSAPDGYTLLAIANTFAAAPSLVPSPGYDPLKDFAGITQTCLVPQVLVVHPSLAARTVKELIALAKAHPGELAYGSAGVGATAHVAAELFARQAGVKMLHVPYKGQSLMLVDLVGGQIMLTFDQISTSMPYINAGRMRALGVTSAKRSPVFPELPTIAEAGLPGYESATYNGILAPAGTPREILVRLHGDIALAVQDQEMKARFLQQGVELVASPSPEAFTQFLRNDVAKMAKLARDAGLKPE